MKFFGKRKPGLTPEQALAAKPIRLVEAQMESTDAGGKLKVALQNSGWKGRLFRMPDGATKTFEFDNIGVFVWENIDGRTSVQQLIRKLSKKYKLSEREAAVSTNLFLQTLGRKSLIGWNVEDREPRKPE